MSIKILAFNTTTNLCSVALMINQKIYDYSIFSPRKHAEKILPMINKLLVETGVTLNSLDCIIFDQGPGSFIGVRVGISVAQGLALGADLPLVSVSSLLVLAQGAYRFFSARRVIATIDARMGSLYWGSYYRGNGNNVWKGGNEFLVTEKVIQKYMISMLQKEWILVGTGWNNFNSLVYVKEENDPILFRSTMFPEARDMLTLGITKWNDKVFLTAEKVKPIYLKEQIVS